MPKRSSNHHNSLVIPKSIPPVLGVLILGALAVVALTLITLPKRSALPTTHETVAGITSLKYPVAELPPGNLIKNPWFATPSCSGPSLDWWTSEPNTADHRWTASDKPTNPSPTNGCATAGRISVGENEGLGGTVQPDKDIKMYQIVAANPENRYLVFDMYWVAHTMNQSAVTIYGSDSDDPNGTWTKLWTPFSYSVAKQLIPPAGVDRVVWLWKCYSDHLPECADAPELPVRTKLSRGYAFYKIEFSANLPAETGGYKQTGVYFTSVASPEEMPPKPETPKPTPSPRSK